MNSSAQNKIFESIDATATQPAVINNPNRVYLAGEPINAFSEG